jgi:ADP-ribose pyrophosphatase YjhB (NUDIX family)
LSVGRKRKEISSQNLHLSSFVIAKKKGTSDNDYSILLLKAGEKHPLSFRRGRLILPSTILEYGEKPRDAARRVLDFEISRPDLFQALQFLNMQTYYGAHWDIVFLYETWLQEEINQVEVKAPFVSASFYPMNDLPRKEISEDHLEVLDEMLRPSSATQ